MMRVTPGTTTVFDGGCTVSRRRSGESEYNNVNELR
jgi:hypothetical protein